MGWLVPGNVNKTVAQGTTRFPYTSCNDTQFCSQTILNDLQTKTNGTLQNLHNDEIHMPEFLNQNSQQFGNENASNLLNTLNQ